MDEACAYIAEQGAPLAAQRLSDRLADAMLAACDFPLAQRRIAANVFEITTVWPYIIRYRIQGDAVRVLRVRHGARRPD